MPRPRAEIGQRWWIEGLGRRVIVSIQHHKKQGRLYGVRDGRCPEYPLGPVSAIRDRGRFVRARSLKKRDKRIRPAYLTSQSRPQNGRQPPLGLKRDSSLVLASCGSQGER